MQTKKKIARDVILVTLIVGVAGCWIHHDRRHPTTDNVKKAVPYTIIYDQMDTVIKIGLPASIDEEQLRATLTKAANDHQDDEARDYIMLCCLWVEAYLIQDGKQSSVAAGELRRSVTEASPAERRKMTKDRTKDDSLTITLNEAKKTL
jgi:hypothetical protein